MFTPSTRFVALSAFAALCLGATEIEAANVNTADFLAACIKDPVIAEDPSFEAAKVTPEAYCQCVVGQLNENNVSQADVDMLTKMHNEDISDADADAFPNLDGLLVANEGYEDACRQSLGVSFDDSDMEEFPEDADTPPDEEPSEDEETTPDADNDAPRE
ncbi:MAG: hypothetical protein ACOYB4_02220 [Methyloceanibacter sp.]